MKYKLSQAASEAILKHLSFSDGHQSSLKTPLYSFEIVIFVFGTIQVKIAFKSPLNHFEPFRAGKIFEVGKTEKCTFLRLLEGNWIF